MKISLKLDHLIEEKKIKDAENLIGKNSPLEFFDKSKIDELKQLNELSGSSNIIATINILGEYYAIIMKKNLSDAILDPSEEDSDLLRDAGRKTTEKLKEAYTKKALKPLESNFERTLFDKYLSSLLMRINVYPKDELNKDTLRDLGINNPNISKLYVSAAASWLGSSEGLEGIINSGGVLSHLEKIGYTGKRDEINLSCNQCHSESHFVLTVKANTQQALVQKETPTFNENYQEIENVIVTYIQNNAKNNMNINHARNLVRLYLNLTALYKAKKPLPLEW